MQVKKKGISPYIVSQLTDWEILSVFAYCNKLIAGEETLYQEELEDICFFFFDGDTRITIESLEVVKRVYVEEFSKRHCN